MHLMAKFYNSDFNQSYGDDLRRYLDNNYHEVGFNTFTFSFTFIGIMGADFNHDNCRLQ